MQFDTYSNWISIIGNQEEVQKFWAENPRLDFDKIIPIKDILESELNCDYGDAYQWEIGRRWGCDGFYDDETDTIKGHRNLKVEENNIYFETETNNPEKIVRELSKQYPMLKFRYEWIERSIFLERAKGEYSKGKCKRKNIDVALGVANLIKSDLKDLREAEKMMKELYKKGSTRTIK